ncbi:hypothetical protein D3C71_1452850 [compost metagenome]
MIEIDNIKVPPKHPPFQARRVLDEVLGRREELSFAVLWKCNVDADLPASIPIIVATERRVYLAQLLQQSQQLRRFFCLSDEAVGLI